MPFVILALLALITGLVIGTLGLFIPCLILLAALWIIQKICSWTIKTKRTLKNQK